MNMHDSIASLPFNCNTSNLTGDLTYVQTINHLKNNPDEWYAVLTELLNLPEGGAKQKILKYFYNEAKKILDAEQHKCSESYANILIHEGIFFSANSPDEAREMFELAATKCRRLPNIHLAFAQFELSQGRRGKALKALQCGLAFTHSQSELKTAIKKINDGESVILPNYTMRDTGRRIGPKHESSVVSKPRRILTHREPLGNITSQHTLAEVLDLPGSPCSSDLNDKIKARVTLQQHQKHLARPIANTMNISEPKTPILSSGTLTRSITCQFTNEQNLNHPGKKLKMENVDRNDASSSLHNFGKPQRILRSQQSNSDDERDECFVKNKKTQLASKNLMESPLLKENRRPVENEQEKAPPSFQPRIPQQHSSGKELQEWLLKSNGYSEALHIRGKPYIIIKELGFGGSSKVFEVLDVLSKSIKALKQVNLRGCDKSVKDGFVNEIKFLERLKGNQTIIHLFDHDITEDSILMVMECGSTDLAKLMHQHKTRKIKLEAYEVWYFWKKMLSAVKTIHDHGVIHNDLKPANFLLVKGNLKLIDFGIANSLQADATSIIKDTQFGTLNYMAPETIMDMSGGFQTTAPKFKVGPSADVWSLGCILYFMMYGRTPFQHISHQIMKLNAIQNPACRIDFDDYPDTRLLQIVQSCLQRDPKLRPKVEHLLCM